MKLTILERLMLISVLPQEGNILTVKIVQDLKADASFSEEELEEHEIVLSDGRVDWNPESNEYIKEIPFGPQAMKVIVESLEKLNSEEKLTEDFITLYEKFMETTE